MDNEIKHALNNAKDKMTTSVEDAKSKVSEATTKVMDAVGERADAAKETVADQGERIAQTLRKSASGHTAGSLQDRVVDIVATGVSDLSEGIRSRSFASVWADVTGLARRNPGVFVAGAALAGFALARFARSSQSADRERINDPNNGFAKAVNQVPGAASPVSS